MKIKKDEIPDKVKKIIRVFQKAKIELFVVGGSSRGLLTKHRIEDWDFATNATPKQILALFPKNSFYQNKFGTVSVVMGKNKNDILEITTYRTEGRYSDKRRPDQVRWGKTIEEDLSRRDLTINAIAINFEIRNSKSEIRKIVDPSGGREDLKKKIIRAVGDPDQRFKEDSLRLLRAVRIATQLGFIIEPNTFKSIEKNAGLIEKIAWERIQVEIFKLLSSKHPADGLLMLFNSGLLQHLMPELIQGRGVDQAKHHIHDVWTHAIETLRFCDSKNPVTRLAALLHDIGKPVVVQGEGEDRSFHNHEVVGAAIAKKIGLRLRLSNKQLDKLWRLVRWHQFAPDENLTDAAIRRFIRRVGKENLDDILSIRTGDRVGSGVPKTSWRTDLFKKRLVEVQKQPFSVADLKVSGNDVMEILEIGPGPEVGRILKQLFEEVEEDKERNKRKYLMERIKKLEG
ncbi:CCA tRNA nucleotidyltransferase [Patescibacteria group bacterium]|nr:CCA tRNA nucleotidyltransferase [Patescibacteria group bacterium]